MASFLAEPKIYTNIGRTEISQDSLVYTNTSGLDFGTGTDSTALYTIRADSSGSLLATDVYGYINAVNNKEIEPTFRDTRDITSTVTGTVTGSELSETFAGTTNSYEITNSNVFSAVSNNNIKWYTDAIVSYDGSIIVGETEQRLQKRQKIKSGLTIITKSRANLLPKNVPANELVAIETLREEVSETEFRRYMKYVTYITHISKVRNGKK